MYSFSNTEFLIDQIIKSDKEAIDYFHKRYHRLIYKCMRDIVKKKYPYDNESALQKKLADLYIDVFIKILSNIHNLREKEEMVLRSFIWQIARTTTIDYCEKARKEEKITSKTGAYEDNPSILYDDHNDEEKYSAWDKETVKELIIELSEKSCQQQEQGILSYDLEQAIEKQLDEREGLVINLCLTGLTGEEIAKTMRLNRTTIQLIKDEAIEKLRECLFLDPR